MHLSLLRQAAKWKLLAEFASVPSAELVLFPIRQQVFSKRLNALILSA
jgi:hypothetical protein